jgi:tetratricopeptide (TPR) repeat protein
MRLPVRFAVPVAALLLLSTILLSSPELSAAEVHTYWLNQTPQVREAYDHFYNLDYIGAVERFEHIYSAHPHDPVAGGYLLNAVVFQELFRQDLLDTTFYANDGFLTGKRPTPEDPKVRDRIFALEEEVVADADKRLKSNNRDADALFARGWARSLRCTYIAMVERAFGTAFHLALQAHSDNVKVLEIDPEYVDAKLIVGVYQYTVGALPFAFKLMLGITGMWGSKTKGLELLHDSASRGVLTSIESRTVIALFLRREARYLEAIQVVKALRTQYPHDFLFALEEGNLLKDAGKGPEAIKAYRDLLADADKPGFYPSSHSDLAWFGLGETLRGQTIYKDAAEAFLKAAYNPSVGAELKRRSFVNAGNCYDLLNDHPKAILAYKQAIDAGTESTQADLARRYIRSPYHLK